MDKLKYSQQTIIPVELQGKNEKNQIGSPNHWIVSGIFLSSMIIGMRCVKKIISFVANFIKAMAKIAMCTMSVKRMKVGLWKGSLLFKLVLSK